MQAWVYDLAEFAIVGRHHVERHFVNYGKVFFNLTHSNCCCIARKVVPAVRKFELVVHIADLGLQTKPHLSQFLKTVTSAD